MQNIPVPKSLEPFVKDIYTLESDDESTEHKFPFYADGFPGIIYSKSTNPFYLQPRNKKLSDFYLYGQTIEPISLDTTGAFRLVGMRLYPFTVRILLGIDSKVLNDDCFDLMLVDGVDTEITVNKLKQTDDPSHVIDIITNYFHELLENVSIKTDMRIQLAINLILNSNGLITVQQIRDKLSISERTLERHFLKEIGVTAKQFAKIIQFSASLNQMTESDYYNLTEIGYDNGFADQSHFIREFKRYAGKTPREFQKQISP